MPDGNHHTRSIVDRALIQASRLVASGARARREPLDGASVDERHLTGATLVPNRHALLRLLPSGGVAAEIGVDRGDFTAEILTISQPSVLHLIDPWKTRRYGRRKEEAVRARFAEEARTGRIVFHRALSTDALPGIADDSLDWAYIDSDHKYRTTAAELELLERKVKRTGMIAGHDFVSGNWIGGVRYGVVEAVNEFCVTRGWRFVALTHEPDRHLNFAITRL